MMLKWLIDNEKWLFSGVLVTVPLAIFGWIFVRGGFSRRQKADHSSVNIQGGRDVTVLVQPDQSIAQSGKPLDATEHNATTSPDFKISILGANIFIPDGRQDLTGVAIDARIRNAGAPSLATEWALEIRLPNGEIAPAYPSKIPDELKLSGPSGTTKIRAGESLDTRTFSCQIASGEGFEGQLLFYTKASKPLVLDLNTVFKLSVEDVSGKRFTSSQRVGDLLR